MSSDPCAIQWVLVGGYFLFFRLGRGGVRKREVVACHKSHSVLKPVLRFLHSLHKADELGLVDKGCRKGALE